MVFGVTTAADSASTIDSGSSTLGGCPGSFVGGGSALTSPMCRGAAGVFAPAVIAAKESWPVCWLEGRAGPALRGQLFALWPASRHKTRLRLVFIKYVNGIPLDINSTGDTLSEFYLQPEFRHAIPFVGDSLVPRDGTIFSDCILNSLLG